MAIRMLHAIFAVLLATAGLAPEVEAQTLLDAIKDGDRKLAERLLDEGADIEKAGVMTPLYMAAQRGDAAMTALLLARGAEVNALTRFGAALHIAARRNHLAVVSLLLEAGADPELPAGEWGLRPLHGAAQTGAFDAARKLLERGADPNGQGTYGRPPIHFAAEKGHTGMVALLREYGAAPVPVEPIAPGDLAAADPALGKVRLHECQRCHVTEPDQAPTGAAPGPNLWNVVGREVAGVGTYAYSDAIRMLEGTWTPDRLNSFLADPTGYAPGTAMYLGGETNREKRLALIAHLMTLSDAPMALK